MAKGPWEEYSAPAPATEAPPWEQYQTPTATVTPVAKPKPEKSMLQKFIGMHPAVAAGETALNLASSTVAAPLSGLAGLGAAAGRALGLTKADPAEVVRNVGSSLTYAPRSEGGQAVSGAIAAPFEKLAEGADWAGSKTAEVTGLPSLGAAVNTAIQAAPTIVGKGLKKPAANRLAKAEKALALEKAENAPRDMAVAAARELDYTLPPAVAGSKGPLSSFFSGVAGGTALDYGSSFKNQRVTNRRIAQELNLPLDEAITKEALADYRNKYGAAYEGVKKAVPELVSTKEFKGALQNPNSKFGKAKAEFPEYFKNSEIDAMVKSLSKDKFSTEAAIELQKKLRYDGYDNLKAFDNPSKKALGEAQVNAANAIDNLIDQNLAMKAPAGVNNFRSKLTDNLAEARKRIAQSYVVEKALNPSTGNISAQALAKMWDKGQPLSGELKNVAQTAKAFKQQMRDVDKLPGTASESISNLDVAKATGLAALGHGALGTLATVGRMGAKPLLLSDWYQNWAVKPPTYAPGAMQRLPAQAFNSPYYPLATIPRPPMVDEEQR